MKKKLRLFLSLFFILFYVQEKIHASFFEPSTVTKDYGILGDFAYATEWDPSGTYLAVGGVHYPTDVTIYQWNGNQLTPYATLGFGNGAYAINWSPDGHTLVIGGQHGYNSLILYNWDGQTLTLTTSKYHGTQVNALAWHPAGNILAVGGNWNNNDLALYNWNNLDTLTLTTSKSHGTQINALAWHPDGTKLAVAGINGSNDVILYNWNGSLLTTLATKNHGTQADALAWTHTGTWLAVGGTNSPNDVIIYTLSGSTLTLTTSIHFGTQAKTLSWSFDDQFLTVGGNNNNADLITYKWNGSTLTKIYDSQINYGAGAYSTSWSPYSEYLAVAGNNNFNDLSIYTNHSYLNGTKNNVRLPDHYLFTNNGYASGAVHFTNGCTILPAQKLKLELLNPLSGGLDLRNTGTLELEDDLYLDSSVTLSAGGYINGQNHTIYLGNNLTIPENTILHISSDTIIDGNEHNLILNNLSQLSIDSNITLTLKNLTLQNTQNTQVAPPLSLAASSSKLALDNVTLALSDDFYFTTGQLFIYNDVAFTGTSQFIYNSPNQSYITKNATLYFAPHTTLNYAPTTTNKNLLSLEDTSSNLYLDGCTLQITHTGLQLTKGQLFLDNNVTFSSAYNEILLDSTFTFSRKYGNNPNSVAWNPNGTYLAVGGNSPTDKQEIQVFSFNGTSLTYTASADYGPILPSAANVQAVSWSPDGTYLAVGGSNPIDKQEIKVFNFNGTSLTYTASADYGPTQPSGATVYAVSWSPYSTYLAVGGTRPTDKQEIKVFSFNGTSLTYTASADYGPISPQSIVRAVSWSPNGTYLAVGGARPTDKQEIKVFSFNGTSLTYTASADYGPASPTANVYAVSWSPDGTYLAVGGSNPTDKQEIKIFSFNGTSLTYTASTNYRPNILGTVRAVSWSPDGTYLAANGNVTGTEKNISVFSFDGSSLTKVPAACQQLETFGSSVAWKPDGTYFAATGSTFPNGYLGVYKFKTTSYQSASNSLIFGNSALGPDYNLNIDVLSGANINQHCFVNFDEA